VAAEHSLLSLFTQAGPIVKFIMLALLAASVVSWTFIIQRATFLKKARSDLKEFEQVFWSGTSLTHLYQTIQQAPANVEKNGLKAIFSAGFAEFLRLRKQSHIDAKSILEGAQRAMRAAQSKELEKLENHVSFLATVGSTAPYVGLFGTVWGIMNSFRALGQVQQATIAMVAPGIAEALIATAMGLFAAIPAVIAYNRYSDQIERLLNQYEYFQEEFSSILYRQAQAGHTVAPELRESIIHKEGPHA